MGGRKLKIKKNIAKESGMQNQQSRQLGKKHKKLNLVILNAMINIIKSLKKLVG